MWNHREENKHTQNETTKLLSLLLSFAFILTTISMIISPLRLRFRSDAAKLNYSVSVSVPLVELHTTRNSRIPALTTKSNVNKLSNHTVLVLRKPVSKQRKVELGLARARASILSAAAGFTPNVSAVSVYRNPDVLYRSYKEMEKRFKVYVYSDGDPPIVHDGPCKSLYTTEGRFIHEMEQGASRFKTKDPSRAHVYFLPFSVTWMVKYMHKPLSRDMSPLRQFVADYVRMVSTKYPYWNRTHGADHFMLACHDWGPHVSQGNSLLYNTSIRVLCNANASEGFNPQKDVSLPEIYLYGGIISPKLKFPPPSFARRPLLAFFAGGLHGPVRPILLQNWKDRDADIHVSEYLQEGLDYYDFMLKSKFCLCPSGYEVASPRIVEAIYAECVPVILSENYVLPFSDVLQWDAFSIQLEVSEIPKLKDMLRAVSEEKYKRLKEGLKAVRKHFVLNRPAKKFDAFHMILHSVWLRRINVSIR